MKFRVDIIESEEGCGDRLDEQKFFDSSAEAWKFVADFNSRNVPEDVPDCYMFAEDPVEES